MTENNTKYPLALVCEPGCEEFAKIELETRFGVNKESIETINSCALFETNLIDSIKIMYKSQSAKRILITLSKGKFDKSLDSLEKEIDKTLSVDFLKKILQKQSIKLECERHGTHEFRSVDVEKKIGFLIEEKISDEAKVDLKNPEIHLFINIDDDSFVLGVDISGRDLSKRQYRVFSHPNNIKGTIAYSLLMFAGYNKKMILADPFALSGELLIECALFDSEKSVNYFEKKFGFENMKLFENININEIYLKEDKKIVKQSSQPTIHYLDASFKNVSAAKKNSKIAGIDKYISYSRTDPESVDLKIEGVDVIVTRMIEPSKNISEGVIKRIYSSFFENLNHTLKKSGTFNCIVRNPEFIIKEIAQYKYKEVKRKEIYQGKQLLYFLQLKKT